MEAFRFISGRAPLLVSMPHVGTYVPEAIAARLSPAGRLLADTDWHVERLYDFLDSLEVPRIVATHSRYVVDLNRPPDGAPLYPGGSNTGLCPDSSFAEEPLYLPGQAPDAAEIAERRETYWQPYHDCLAETLAAMTARHGRVVLWDAHSIRSRVPRFFEGRLRDLNFGTAEGASAAADLAERVVAVARGTRDLDFVLDGRFTGGYITRHYGRAGAAVQAMQLELSQATYMDEDPPFTFREDLAERLRPLLTALLAAALGWIRGQGP